MRKGLLLAVAGVLCVAAAALAQGRGQAPAPAKAEVILIGCLERSGANAFALKDFRDGITYQIVAPPEVTAPAESIAWHAGHKLEIHGALEGNPSQGQMRLRATQIMYIANNCK